MSVTTISSNSFNSLPVSNIQLIKLNWKQHRLQIIVGGVILAGCTIGLGLSLLVAGKVAWSLVAVSIVGMVQSFLIIASGLFQSIPEKRIEKKIEVVTPVVVELPKEKIEPSLVEKVFEKLTGKPFNEKTTPEMEYTVHSIFEAIAENENKLLKTLMWEIEDDAPENLYAIARKGAFIAKKYHNYWAYDLLKDYMRTSGKKPFNPTKRIGLNDKRP